MGTSKNPTYKIAELIVGELDHFKNNFHPQGGERTFHTQIQLTHEPFIGYVHVTDINNIGSKLLICRHYTPFNFKPRGRSVEFASYLSPLGRIIAKKPGQTHSFRIGGVSEDFRLIEKDDFTFHVENGLWDASNNQIAWIDGRMLARSLRKILEAGPEVEAKPDVEQVRQLRYSVQLPDQAILDQVQDEIFRLPLQARIRITGAPGTGKTTVLLKRLSQKTKKEFLTEAEQKGLSDQVFKDGKNWILFTPSDLLKVYLKEAMAKELLPATDEHVKVYPTLRLEVLRDGGFIKVGPHGYFKQAPAASALMKRT